MLIWDIIRDWFVMNIWGGITHDGESYAHGTIGFLYNSDTLDNLLGLSNETYVPIRLFSDISESTHNYISIGDWLSTTSTIIVLVAVSVGLYFLTRYFFRMFAGLLSGR